MVNTLYADLSLVKSIIMLQGRLVKNRLRTKNGYCIDGAIALSTGCQTIISPEKDYWTYRHLEGNHRAIACVDACVSQILDFDTELSAVDKLTALFIWHDRDERTYNEVIDLIQRAINVVALSTEAAAVAVAVAVADTKELVE